MYGDNSAESENAAANRWAVMDMEGEIIKRGFDSEEAAEIWTTTDDGKKDIEKRGGTFSVEELAEDDQRSEDEGEK